MKLLKKMKINILFKFVDGPWGGGNQFLKSLRNYFEQVGVYENDPKRADVILFNSYPFGSEYLFKKLFLLLKQFKETTIVHRVDGPIFSVRGTDFDIDKVIFYFNNKFTEGTIFQSDWSKTKCHELGIEDNKFETVITNAPDKSVFFPKIQLNQNVTKGKVSIVAVSWSANVRKGFNIYKYLDANLDFNKYQMTFIGNSPFKFKNISHIKPLDSECLAGKLREHDLYITASENDPCSNSLLEALHCKLPVIALNSGGHPEIIGNGGVAFEGEFDVIRAIEKVASNLEHYNEKISVISMTDVGERYYNFCEKVHAGKVGKSVTFLNYMKLFLMCCKWKLRKRFGTKKVK